MDITVYLPDELGRWAKSNGIRLSRTLRAAVEAERARRNPGGCEQVGGLPLRLAAVAATVRWRDRALTAKLNAEAEFDRVVTECHANGVNWQGMRYEQEPMGDEYRSAPAKDDLLARLDNAWRGLEDSRSDLRTVRRRLDRAYRDLGKAVAANL